MNILPTFQDRLQLVLKEINGVSGQYGITWWEKEFMNDMVARDIGFGSKKQNEALARIETKVFGEDED